MRCATIATSAQMRRMLACRAVSASSQRTYVSAPWIHLFTLAFILKYIETKRMCPFQNCVCDFRNFGNRLHLTTSCHWEVYCLNIELRLFPALSPPPPTEACVIGMACTNRSAVPWMNWTHLLIKFAWTNFNSTFQIFFGNDWLTNEIYNRIHKSGNTYLENISRDVHKSI